MPLQATSGAASYDGFGGGVAAVPTYIEDVMSTWLYTGNGSTQTITNNIDLSGKGGLVWAKNRIQTYNHTLIDSANGVGYQLESNTTAALANGGSAVISSFNSDGFSVGSAGRINYSGDGIASWTFRKQPKFFDIQTWTGNSTAGRQISHALGSTPGCIIIKRTSDVSDWMVYHRSIGATQGLFLNTTDAAATNINYFNNTEPTSTNFTLGTSSRVNESGGTYVAYIFAHDAGGFGLNGTDNVISCGSFTTDGSGNATVSLGYEPQWLLVKGSSGETNWLMADNMRGWSETNIQRLFADASNADSNYTANAGQSPTATGFKFTAGLLSNSTTYIYIAIRRGPMKVPTDATKVFVPIARTGTGADAIVTTGTNADLITTFQRTQDSAGSMYFFDKLRGNSQGLRTAYTNAESYSNPLYVLQGFGNTSYPIGSSGTFNTSALDYINYSFTRAPSFFDEVCYTGTGVIRTITHNLAAVPELMIVKGRSIAERWSVYSAPTTATTFLVLDSTQALSTNNFFWDDTAPTSSVFTLGTQARVNNSGDTYVAYLFATCAGVSKVFSYTGNGSSQTINCGFTGGARFVLIKRTDSTGNWYVWDTARGIVSGNDPYLLLNSTAAEVTTNDTIDTDSTGFVVNQVTATSVNVSSATYIGLAIA